MASSRRFTRPQGKKPTGVAKNHPRPVAVALVAPDEDRGTPPLLPPAARRILVADANAEAIASIAFALAGVAYRVSTVLTADELLRALRRERYDLIVLGAPGGARGIDVLRELRGHFRPEVFGTQTENVAVVMTIDGNDEDHEAQRYVALAQGADDALVTPFNARELLLRVASILRRAPNPPADAPDAFRLGNLYIDFAGHHVMVEDDVVHLTRKEFALLRILARHVGHVCDRARLSTSADTERSTPGRTTDMQISRLRRKLGVAGAMIENVRGEGYRLERARSRAHP